MNTLKMDSYDKFRCIADQCPFTCCKGWEIKVDTDTASKWLKDDKQILALSKNIKGKKSGKETDCSIKLKTGKVCPLLDEKGLCRVVIHYGDDYLSNTCRIYPRQINSMDGWEEYSLSCTCPAAVDLINGIDGKTEFHYSGEDEIRDLIQTGYKARAVMISLLSRNDFSLKDRLLLVFHFLLLLKNNPDEAGMMNRYSDIGYLKEIKDIWSKITIISEDALLETNELLLDIVQNYKKEHAYRAYFESLSDFAEVLRTEEQTDKWRKFKETFHQYDGLIENCIVSKIFANCFDDDTEEMIFAFQRIITEYVMVRYSVFLYYLQTNKDQLHPVEYDIVRDYIVAFSRIIEYNADGMKEFWEDSFEEAVWDFGYMLLLIND